VSIEGFATIIDVRDLDYSDQLKRIYGGELFVYQGIPEMQHIVSFTRTFLEDHLAPFHPTEIHRDGNIDALPDKLKAVGRAYRAEPRLIEYWHAFYDAIGMPAESHAEDRAILRFHIPESARTNDRLTPHVGQVPPHRDTWGSNLYAQLNWWAPIYPLAPNRTFSIAPQYWAQPVGNTTRGFDMRRAIRVAANPGLKASVSDIVPVMTSPYPYADSVSVLIQPSEILAFSAQHLHAGQPNTSDLTRISLDTRTIHIDHVRERLGAVNIDGEAPLVALNLFRRISDGCPLHDVLGCSEFEALDGGPSA